MLFTSLPDLLSEGGTSFFWQGIWVQFLSEAVPALPAQHLSPAPCAGCAWLAAQEPWQPSLTSPSQPAFCPFVFVQTWESAPAHPTHGYCLGWLLVGFLGFHRDHAILGQPLSEGILILFSITMKWNSLP